MRNTLKRANTFETEINGRTIENLSFARLLFFHFGNPLLDSKFQVYKNKTNQSTKNIKGK